MYLFVRFYWVFNSHCAQAIRFCSKRIFLLVNCKCHPVGFNVITIIGSRTSTPTPKLICHHASIVSLFDPNLIELIGQKLEWRIVGKATRFVKISFFTTWPGGTWVGSVSNKHNPSAKSGLDACISSRITNIGKLIRGGPTLILKHSN